MLKQFHCVQHKLTYGNEVLDSMRISFRQGHNRTVADTGRACKGKPAGDNVVLPFCMYS